MAEPVGLSSQARTLAERVIGAGLPGVRGIGPGDVADPALTDELRGWALREGVRPLLLHSLLLGGCDESRAAAVVGESADVLAMGLAVDAALVACRRELTAAGVDYRVLKGAATAHLVYPDPSWRTSGDLDLAVRAGSFDAARDVLRRMEMEQLPEEYFGPVSSRLKKADTFRRPGARVAIDLHHRIDVNLGGFVLPEQLAFDRPRSFEIMGVTMPAMNRESMLLHAALHLAAYNTRLSTMADLARLAHDPALDLDRLASAAEESKLVTPLAWAVERTREWVPLPDTFCERLQLRRRFPLDSTDRFLIAHPRIGSAVHLVRVAQGFDRVRVAGEVVWPTSAFLASKDRRRFEHVGRVGRAAVAGLKRQSGRIRSDHDYT